MSGARVDKDQPKTSGGTPMYTAASAGNGAVVQLRCNAGAYTVLLIWMVRQTVVQLQCNTGTNSDPHVIDGATPIFIAAVKGNKAVARLLCEAGANKIRL